MIPLSDPGASYRSAKEQVNLAIERVMGSGNYILGVEVETFEREFAEYIGVAHAVAVANGTDALALSLRAVGVGAGRGRRSSEVITVSNTAVATVAAIEQCGATPVLVDVDPETMTIDFDRVREVTTEHTAAVIPVHLYGQPADMDRALEYQAATDVPVIEDSSQAHGAHWRHTRVGSIGLAGTFSCYPTKNLGALGDAGIVTTGDEGVAGRLRMIRQYGWHERNWSLVPGVNSRMDELQAAILRVHLTRLDERNARRVAIAHRYNEAFADLPIKTPVSHPLSSHVFHLYVCVVDDRDAFRAWMHDCGVSTAVRYPHAIHQQPAYQDRIRLSPMPVTESLTKRIVSLPLYPELDDVSVEAVIDAVVRYYS